MTTHHIRLAFDLLGDLFADPNIKEVASYLSRKGPLSFAVLARDLKLPSVNLARALSTLAIHDIIECQSDVRSKGKGVLYAFNLKRTLYILHYSKCIHCARQLFGFDGELIVEELLLSGKLRMSTLLVKVYERLIKAGKDPQTHSLQSIKDSFKSLVAAQFLQRIRINETKSNMPEIVEETLTNAEHIPELTPEGWRYLVTNQQQEARPPAPKFGDENIFWKVNFPRLFAYLRDQELIQAFTDRIDQVALIFNLLGKHTHYFRMPVKSFEPFFVSQKSNPVLIERSPSHSSM